MASIGLQAGGVGVEVTDGEAGTFSVGERIKAICLQRCAGQFAFHEGVNPFFTADEQHAVKVDITGSPRGRRLTPGAFDAP